jgi:hypothetical protein
VDIVIIVYVVNKVNKVYGENRVNKKEVFIENNIVNQ